MKSEEIDKNSSKDLNDKIRDLEKNKTQFYKEICYQLWNQPQIHADGTILGCCSNFWGSFGNVSDFKSTFEAINNEKMKYARNMLSGNVIAREDIPCTSCTHYKELRDSKNWVTKEEVILNLKPQQD